MLRTPWSAENTHDSRIPYDLHCLIGVPERLLFTLYVACACSKGPTEPEACMSEMARHASHEMSKGEVIQGPNMHRRPGRRSVGVGLCLRGGLNLTRSGLSRIPAWQGKSSRHDISINIDRELYNLGLRKTRSICCLFYLRKCFGIRRYHQQNWQTERAVECYFRNQLLGLKSCMSYIKMSLKQIACLFNTLHGSRRLTSLLGP